MHVCFATTISVSLNSEIITDKLKCFNNKHSGFANFDISQFTCDMANADTCAMAANYGATDQVNAECGEGKKQYFNVVVVVVVIYFKYSKCSGTCSHARSRHHCKCTYLPYLYVAFN